MFNKKFIFIFVALLLAFFIFKGESLKYKTVFHRDYKNINFDRNSVDKKLSAVKAFDENEFENFKDKLGFKEIEIAFKFKVDSITEWDNLFQTAAVNDGIRLELSKAKTLGLVINSRDGLKGFPVLSEVKFNKLYDLKIKINKDNLVIFIDGLEVLNVIDDSLNYKISEIAIGTGFSKTRPFNGLIQNFCIDYKILKPSFFNKILYLVPVSKIILFLIILFLIIQNLNRNRIILYVKSHKKWMFIFCVFLLVVVIFKGEIFQYRTVKSGVHKNINFDSKAADNKLSAVKEFSENNFDNLKDQYGLNEVEIAFKFKVYSITEWDNLFQTAAVNNGIRLELNKDNFLSIVISGKDGDVRGYPLTEIKFNKVYALKIKIDQKNRLTVVFDNKEILNIAEDFFDYSISEIAVGTGFSKTRSFNGSIENFRIKYKILKEIGIYKYIKNIFITMLCVLLGFLLFDYIKRNKDKIIFYLKITKLTDIRIYPFLFSVYPILFLFSQNIFNVAYKTIFICLVISILATFFIYCIFYCLILNKHKSSIMTTLFLFWFFSTGHFYSFLNEKGINLASNTFILVMIFILFIGFYLIMYSRRDFTQVEFFVKNLVIILILFSCLTVLLQVFKNNQKMKGQIEHQINNYKTGINSQENLPDIYYIILDGYANNQTLKDYFNYDNSDFTNFLAEKKFKLASKSTSNYRQTILSVPSSLNMEYLKFKDTTEINNYFENNKVVLFLKSKGYFFINSNTSRVIIPVNKNADLNISADTWDDFYSLLLESTILFNTNLFNFKRNEINISFQSISTILKEKGSPKFVYIHILAPHHPYVFGKYGEKVLINKQCDLQKGEMIHLNKTGYVNQLIFINNETKKMINKILSQSQKPPLIILQSDHGPDLYNSKEIKDGKIMTSTESQKARFRILNAYFLPDGGEKILYDTITPVNTFRSIFNYYFKTDFELLPDMNYYSPDNLPFLFTDVTETVKFKD